MFDVELDKQPLRFLRKCDAITAGRITEKLKILGIFPIPPDAVRLKGADAWRVRIGDHRMIYYINYEKKRIAVVKIGHRSNVYDRLE